MQQLHQQVKKTAVRKTVKIGRPGYRVTKEREKETEQKALLFEVKRQFDDSPKGRSTLANFSSTRVHEICLYED